MISRRIEEGNYPFGPGRTGWQRWIGPAVGLLWLIPPLVNTLQEHPSGAEVVVLAVGLVGFAGLYLSRVGRWDESLRAVLVSIVGCLAIAVTLTLAVADNWGALFVYAAALAGLRLPERVNSQAVLGIVALSAATLALAGADDGTILAFAGITFAIGAMFLLISGLVRSNLALREARAELAELAVAEERLRFARDLHDLLGHDLSLIALKAELARKLLPDSPDRARAEADDIHGLTRAALARVREAVAGYRRPTLAGELAGARAALEAAGILLDASEPPPLAHEDEAVLAWAVREGATNVIRHSGASRARIAVTAASSATRLEIVDDGRGVNGGGIGGGHGLEGLRERAALLGGELEAGAAGPGGGFRLAITLPARTAA